MGSRWQPSTYQKYSISLLRRAVTPLIPSPSFFQSPPRRSLSSTALSLALLSLVPSSLTTCSIKHRLIAPLCAGENDLLVDTSPPSLSSVMARHVAILFSKLFMSQKQSRPGSHPRFFSPHMMTRSIPWETFFSQLFRVFRTPLVHLRNVSFVGMSLQGHHAPCSARTRAFAPSLWTSIPLRQAGRFHRHAHKCSDLAFIQTLILYGLVCAL
jgi:hypothetical protein